MHRGDPAPDPWAEGWREPQPLPPWTPRSLRLAVTATVMAVLLLHMSAWSNVILLGASQAGTGYPGPDAIPSLDQDAETMRAFIGAMLAHGSTLLVLTVLCVVGRWRLQLLAAFLFTATFLGILIAFAFATPALERAGW
ncbi:hypothetical protein DOT97_03665 [Clavibacter michiganensis subsp. michiganensis]|nr:hypothetical protein [Clavibacter michiganensis subsp. michiganensis]